MDNCGCVEKIKIETIIKLKCDVKQMKTTKDFQFEKEKLFIQQKQICFCCCGFLINDENYNFLFPFKYLKLTNDFLLSFNLGKFRQHDLNY